MEQINALREDQSQMDQASAEQGHSQNPELRQAVGSVQVKEGPGRQSEGGAEHGKSPSNQTVSPQDIDCNSRRQISEANAEG